MGRRKKDDPRVLKQKTTDIYVDQQEDMDRIKAVTNQSNGVLVRKGLDIVIKEFKVQQYEKRQNGK